MTDYYAKAQQLQYDYEKDCRRKYPPTYAYLEVFAELENDLKQKIEADLEAVREQRELLMRGLFLELLFTNGFRFGDNGLWVSPEEAKKEPEAR